MTKSNVGARGTKRLIALGGLAILLSSQVASGMPLDSSSQEGDLPKIHNAEELHQYISTYFEQHQQKQQNRASGYEGIHPLNRRGWGGAGAVEKALFEADPQRRQATAATLANTVQVVTEVSPVAAAAATSDAATQVAASASAAAATSAAPVATSKALPAVTPVAASSPSASSKDSSSSSKSSSTSSSTPSPPSSGIASFFSPHNKLFPLAVAVCIAIGIGALLIIISIGKLVSHANMTPEEKAGAYGDYSKRGKKGDGVAMRGAKSLRRAFTSKKLGSFARRNQEGSVLIDVGDEVYAVTPEVAREYDRERSSMGGSSGGSRLTNGSSNANTLRQALKNAEMIVAANGAGGARANGIQALPKGFDINSWRASSALPGIRAEQGYGNGDNDDGLSRSISQRLTDGFRALRGKNNMEKDNMPRTSTRGAFSFDSEKQDFVGGGMRQAEVPTSAYMPVITRGAKEWDIRPQAGEMNMNSRPLQSKSSESSLRQESQLSHERHTLNDAPVILRTKTVKKLETQPPGAFPDRRPKSILIKKGGDEEEQQQYQAQKGAYRHRKPVPGVNDNVLPYRTQVQRKKTTTANRTQSKRQSSSTSFASPKVLQLRASPALDSSPIFIRPSKPNAALGASKSTETNAPHTRELFRPLPLPPAFSPL